MINFSIAEFMLVYFMSDDSFVEDTVFCIWKNLYFSPYVLLVVHLTACNYYHLSSDTQGIFLTKRYSCSINSVSIFAFAIKIFIIHTVQYFKDRSYFISLTALRLLLWFVNKWHTIFGCRMCFFLLFILIYQNFSDIIRRSSCCHCSE